MAYNFVVDYEYFSTTSDEEPLFYRQHSNMLMVSDYTSSTSGASITVGSVTYPLYSSVYPVNPPEDFDTQILYEEGFVITKSGLIFTDYAPYFVYAGGGVPVFDDTNHFVYYPMNVISGTNLDARPVYMAFRGWVKLGQHYLLPNHARVYREAYFPVFEELDRTVNYYTWSNATVVSNKQPYEQFSGTLTVTSTKNSRTYNSLAIGALSSVPTTMTYTYNNKYYTSAGVKTLYTFTRDNNTSTNGKYPITVTVDDWANKTYTIEQKSGVSYSLYTGKEVDNGFLNAFQVKLVKSNNFGSETSYPKTSLELSKMSETIVSESDTNFTFNYDISDVTETSVTSISKTITSYHKLKTGAGKFANVTRKVSYALGDVISASVDFSTMGSLTYDDDTVISLADVTINSQSKSATYGNDDTVLALPHTVSIDTPDNFTIHYTMNLDYFGSLSFDDLCNTEASAQIGSVVLEGTKSVFHPDEQFVFGSDAKIKIYNEENVLVKTINSSDFNLYISNVDARYNQLAGNYLAGNEDKVLALTFECYGTTLTQYVAINYATGSFAVDNSTFKRSYIFDPEDDDFEFDYTGITLVVTKHVKTVSGDTATDVTSIETLYPVDLTISTDPATLDLQNGKYYATSFSYSYRGQAFSTSTNIWAEPLVIENVVVSGSGNSIKYYDNGVDVFKEPTDLTFTVVFNDPSHNDPLTSDDVDYYRDEAHTQVIEVGDVISKNNVEAVNGTYRIYFYSSTYGVGGYYAITFVVDKITSIALQSAINVYYGSYLKDAKSQITFNCTHESGNVTTLSDPNAYSFVNTSLIMPDASDNPPSGNVMVNIPSEDNSPFGITNTSTHVNWVKPYGKMVVNSANFQTAYNNGVDKVNPATITAKIEYYKDALFTQKVTFEQALTYSSTSTNAYDKFTASGSGILSGYTFNTLLNVSMAGEAEQSGAVVLTANNQFYNAQDTTPRAQTINNGLGVPVTVLEILNITGIKLLNVKREYLLGQTFLDSTDDTRIKIFYKDSNDHTQTFECNLRDGLTGLNVYPFQGTPLNQVVDGKEVVVTSASDYNVSVRYTIDVKPDFIYKERETHRLVALYYTHVCPDGIERTKYFLVGDTVELNGETVETTVATSSGRVLNSNVHESDLVFYGYLDDVNDTSASAKVVLFKDYVPPVEGSNNVTVKFPCYKQGNADLINKCHFGIMFGNNNSKNRLFVSGNADYKNKDWHTGQVDSSQTDDTTMLNGNYGYFEDLSECVYGETDNAVIGYDIVSNDKLLVLKNHSDKETTVYFRQPQLVTAINNSGTAVTGLDDETLYQEEFSLSKGNNSVAGVNPFAVANFNGDSLFISSDNQIVGLDLTGIIGDNQRYANTRSYFIDADLKNYDLSKAFLWTNNKYLFVVLKEKIYVAYYEMKNENQYEWFVLDVANVSSILELDGTIYFGTYDGEIYHFTKNEFEDAKKVFVGYGITRLTINDETEILTASDYLADINTNKKHYFRPIPIENATDGGYVYYSLGTVVNNSSTDTDFYIDNADTRNVIELVAKVNGKTDFTRLDLLLKRIKENVPVFFNRIYNSVADIECAENSSLANAWGYPYFLKEYDGEDATRHLYQVFDENGNLVPIRELYRARLCMRVTEDTEMTEIDVENGTFKLIADGEVLDIVQYNSQLLNAFKGEIVEYSDVEAFYITKPYLSENLEQSKTIWSFTLTNDTNVPSELELCYATNKIPMEKLKSLAKISVDMMGFSLNDFNFSKIDFDKNIVPRTYTHKRVLANVKFICFAFRNYNSSNSVLSSLVVTYTLPYPSYGGD